jgi:hypothetical protein
MSFSKWYNFFLRALNAMSLPLRDLTYSGDCNSVMLVMRHSRPDSDTIPLLEAIGRSSAFDKVFLYSQAPELLRPWMEAFRKCLGQDPIIVSDYDLPRTIPMCRLVFLKNQSNLWEYRLFGFFNRSRIYIRIFHGLITKGFGYARKDSDIKGSYIKKWAMRLNNLGINHYIVQSEVEKYFRAAGLGIKPFNFIVAGYPRFYRAKDLAEGSVAPLILKDGNNVLDRFSDKRKILYAPTHRDGLGSRFFDLTDYNPKLIDDFLETQGAVILIRIHKSCSKGGWTKGVAPKNIVELPPDCVPGSIELMPFIDCLVTDYSSICMEALACSVPIIHIHSGKDPVLLTRGLAFEDMISLPGIKVSETQEFIDALGLILNGKYRPDETSAMWMLDSNVRMAERYSSIWS